MHAIIISPVVLYEFPPLKRLRRRWEDITKMDVREVVLERFVLDGSGSG